MVVPKAKDFYWNLLLKLKIAGMPKGGVMGDFAAKRIRAPEE